MTSLPSHIGNAIRTARRAQVTRKFREHS